MFSPALSSNDSLYIRLVESIRDEARRKSKSKKKVRVVRDKDKERKETESERRERLHPGHDDLRKLGNGLAKEANCGGRSRNMTGEFHSDEGEGSFASDKSCPDKPNLKGKRKGRDVTPAKSECGCEVSTIDGCVKHTGIRCRDNKPYHVDESVDVDREDDRFARYVAGIVSMEVTKLLKTLQKQQKNNTGGCSWRQVLNAMNQMDRASSGKLHEPEK